MIAKKVGHGLTLKLEKPLGARQHFQRNTNLNAMNKNVVSKVMTNFIFVIFISILFGLSVTSYGDASERIIVDPLYGGKESGPIGSSGISAKDIVLSIAKKLGKKIKEQTNYEVIYTRESGNYISIQERVLIANKKNGNVLISIGANGSENKRVNGFEIFVFGILEGCKDLEHNYSDRDSNAELKTIIKDLSVDLIEGKCIKSMELANTIHNELIKEKEVKDRGIKSSPFYLLVGSNIPSVMVMVGFLTNEQDETLLRNSNHQDKIAEALFKGVLHYIQKKEKRGSDR